MYRLKSVEGTLKLMTHRHSDIVINRYEALMH